MLECAIFFIALKDLILHPCWSRNRLCRIACERCGRAGAYRRETLAERFGNMALPDVLIALTACEPEDDRARRPFHTGIEAPSPAGLFLRQLGPP